MRTRMLSLCAIFVTLLLFSCGKKEGVYNPERKIASVEQRTLTVSEQREHQTDDWVFSDSNSYVISEKWTWVGNKLASIRYGHDGVFDGELLEFEYDGERIKRVVEQCRDIVIEFIYDGRKIEEVKMYQSEVEVAGAVFTHKRGKVSSVEQRVIDFYCKEASLFRHIVGMIVNIDPVVAKDKDSKNALATASKGDMFWFYEWFDFEWDGDNVSSMRHYEVTRDNLSAIYEYTFDEANNPYSGMAYSGLNGSFVGQPGQMNANNIVREKTIYNTGSEKVTEYAYTYDGTWPSCKTVEDSTSLYYPTQGLYIKSKRVEETRYTYLD